MTLTVVSTGNEQDGSAHEPRVIITNRERGLMHVIKEVSDFLHYLFNTWLNPLAHKFLGVWTVQVLHFGVETTNRIESEHSFLKLWLLTSYSDLDIAFLNIDSLFESQIIDIKSSLEYSRLKEKLNAKSNPILKNAFWRTLEIDSYHPCSQEKNMGMDSKMRDFTDLLDQISTRPISKVREMRHLVKGVLSPVLLEDPGMTLTSPSEVTATKG
ncbi:hypothetical protein M9H77_35989 [Catharanthus roseus]|uniref:Uncharacterized protein n=1 Tax=Catharanthus roseus TaxID=4058 RepID=A0ACB9ZQK6_CATRO|nr:hypothetical protein M9H77_35989 [Catharanthus roseus]